MKAKETPCKICNCLPEVYGADWNNDEGPWSVACKGCGEGTDTWAYQREAWAQWKYINSTCKQSGD